MSKYLDLPREVKITQQKKKINNMRVMLIPIVAGTFVIVPRSLEKMGNRKLDEKNKTL